ASPLQVLRSFPTRRSSDLPAPVSPVSFMGNRCDFIVGLAAEQPLFCPGPRTPFITEMHARSTWHGRMMNDSTPMGKPLVPDTIRSEEHTSELQSRFDLVCR